ncbi:rhodanese-like domain-containing protein [Pseudooceanicola aestuarii]|uniref:rhodanese-like domain-containing protein n=1 Tax=Pseudooceanicola aestuarii TaxID=2697319 RepID=UPI0013D605C7|nr:rhodanese-like domain-containing protein [Pseudooceanicola aestuarii]
MKVGYRDLIDAAEAEIETLSIEDAQARLEDPRVLFVDLRDRRELEREGRIPGAFHCPRGMLEFWIDPDSPYHKTVFAEDRTFVFYCASAWRSALATKTAQDMGLAPVAHLGGGFSAWKSGGAPVQEVAPK